MSRGKAEFSRKGEIYPYIWNLGDKGYAYEIFAEWKDEEVMIYVCESGVHLEYYNKDQNCIFTNIVPKRLFGDLPSLTEDHLRDILQILINTGMEGKTIDARTIDSWYKEWIELGRP